MTNYDDRDDDADNNGNEDGNEDRNDDDNAASRSGSNSPILNPIMMHLYHGGVYGNDGDSAESAVHYVSTCRTIYLPYKDPIKDVP